MSPFDAQQVPRGPVPWSFNPDCYDASPPLYCKQEHAFPSAACNECTGAAAQGRRCYPLSLKGSM
ncbi:hypothetical protein M378DRAFT_162582 [Amanita muscaria Koide BX008]|uniref:Uncharacterized protein n=1 Tax=Amanita muscaria (strain Koide BX008) TaxID=946122 RepID=A0A0C2WTJ0_AMAMK|nr:hypothetical protein M378DRAFT_162582 [Amanita muscaria Koide BX008]